jgi:hypothetical protein
LAGLTMPPARQRRREIHRAMPFADAPALADDAHWSETVFPDRI